MIFNIDLEKRIIDTDTSTLWLQDRAPRIETIPQGLFDEGLFLKSGIVVVEDLLTEIMNKETAILCAKSELQNGIAKATPFHTHFYAVLTLFA